MSISLPRRTLCTLYSWLRSRSLLAGLLLAGFLLAATLLAVTCHHRDSGQYGSAKVQVEGSNPVVVKSWVQRRRLCSQEKCLITHGDIIELIPGSHLFKYVTDGSHLESSLKADVGISTKGKRKAEDDFLAVKRNHQILKDEAVARALSCVEVKSSVRDETSAVAKSCCSESYTAR